MAKYLDLTGLSTLWGKVKAALADKQDLNGKISATISSKNGGNTYGFVQSVYDGTKSVDNMVAGAYDSATNRYVQFGVGQGRENMGIYAVDDDADDADWLICQDSQNRAKIPKWAGTGDSTTPVYFDEDGIPRECASTSVSTEKANWLDGYRSYFSGTTYGAVLKSVGRSGLTANNNVGCEFLLKCGYLSDPTTINTYRCIVFIRGDVAECKMDLVGGSSTQMWRLCAVRDESYHYGIYLIPVTYAAGSGWSAYGGKALDVTVLPLGPVYYDSDADGETGWKAPESIDKETAAAALTTSFSAFSEKPSFYDASINSSGSPNAVKCDRIVAGVNLIATNQSSSTGQLASFNTSGMLVKKTATVGSATTPVYLDAGVPTACSGASLVACGYDANVHIPTVSNGWSYSTTNYTETGGLICHFYDPDKDGWANSASMYVSDYGVITIYLLNNLTEVPALVDATVLHIISVTRTGTVGGIMGYFTPYPYSDGYPYLLGSNLSGLSSARIGVKAEDCNKAVFTLASILPDFTSAVGCAQCLYTGDKNIHAFFQGGTLSFVADSFGNFSKNAQYFFHIPLVFPSAT